MCTGKIRRCELCAGTARMYCESDDARLCFVCDAKVHSANFLVARHCRTLLCRICHRHTPWKAEGPRLSLTLSLCHKCMDGKTNMFCSDNKKIDDEVGENECEEGEESEEEEDEGDEQVVPDTEEEPPEASSSSCSSSTEKEDEIKEGDEKVGGNFNGGKLKRLRHNMLDLLSNSQDQNPNSLLPYKRATNDNIQAVNEEDATSRPLKLQKKSSMLLPD